MTSLVTIVADFYEDLFEHKGDPRVKGWFLMSSAFPTLIIIGIYVFFVKNLGQKIMANRKPFELKKTLLVYNFIQVLISVYLFYEGGVNGWFADYSFTCQPVDYSNSPRAMRILWATYVYFLAKISELADTVFFILRKKNNQISTLHVFHHSVMPFFAWWGAKYVGGGHTTFSGFLNSFVHIWMYLYYFLAALGPQIQPYLWWKKYLTSMQIIQFVFIVTHEVQLFFIDCPHPRGLSFFAGLISLIFFYLFTDFYIKSYTKKSKKSNTFDVKNLQVDPDREGIKQSNLYTTNYENLVKKRQTQGKELRTRL